MVVLEGVWKWIAGAAALFAVLFLLANGRRHAKKQASAEVDVEWLEQNRTHTKAAAKQAEVAHAKATKSAERVNVIKKQTEKRIEKIRDSGRDVDSLLAQLNAL